MTNGRFHELFGGPPRQPESDLEQRHMDLAASIQAVTEEVMLRDGPRAAPADRACRTWCWPAAWRSTASPTAGCCARGRSTTSGFSRRPATPAARSAPRCSSGTSCSTSRADARPTDRQKGSFLGPRFTTAEICACARRASARRTSRAAERGATCSSTSPTCSRDEKIVGWFQGRMEFGPRALGARSILGDPRSPKMQATMNLKIKFRESFRRSRRSCCRSDAHRVVRARARPGEPVHAAGRAGAATSTGVPDRRTSSARRWRTTPTCAIA